MSAKQNPDDTITLNQLEGIQRSITNRLKQLQKKVRQSEKEVIFELIQLTRENLYRKAQTLCEERDSYKDKFQAICKILDK
jgi:FtsZ-binding cell division protein ZapB